MEALGIPRVDGGSVESDHRKIWQVFADNFYLFRGTPSGAWLTAELVDVFGISQKLDGDSAQDDLRSDRRKTGAAGIPSARSFRTV